MNQVGLMHGLLDPACYPHPVARIDIVETHISWVVLTGDFAYKLKKPIRLPFLDFSTLDQRRHFCSEELRLNRRIEPDLYLAVVPITGSEQQPRVGAAEQRGPVLEYAVKMRQFDDHDLLLHLQARGELRVEHVDALARQIAAFHRECCPAAQSSEWGAPGHVTDPAEENFEEILEQIPKPADPAPVERMFDWTRSRGAELRPFFAMRKERGYIRECHGDLHLGNAFLQNGAIHIFDCIEFNENLRWIDVLNDAAFMVMDLAHRGQPSLSRRFLNRYLEHAGDYDGLPTLAYYLAYRAMVRAKIDLIRVGQPEASASERGSDLTDFGTLIDLAQAFTRPKTPWLAIMHGASGSGKSYLSEAIVESRDCIRIRSDAERKRLHGFRPEGRTVDGIDRGIYSPTATRATYGRMAELAGSVLSAGWPVILDATFLSRWQRDLAYAVARRHHVPCLVLDCRQPPETLRTRVRERSAAGLDISEAGPAVLERQLTALAQLDPEESNHALILTPAGRADVLSRMDRALVATACLF